MNKILALMMSFLVTVPVTAFAQPDWMVKARETEDMIFGRINVDCSHVYNSDVNLCFLQTAFSNATQLSISYMQEWIAERYYNKNESDSRFASIIWNYNQTTPAINYFNNQILNYYTKSESDNRFSPILWAYNQTTPAINYVTNWITSNFFNKTESDARYLRFYNNNSISADVKMVYTVENSTSNSNIVMLPITNLTWNTSSYKFIGFDCFITYNVNSTTNGMALMITVSPNPNSIEAVATFMKGIVSGGADVMYDYMIISNNETAESPSSHEENVNLLATVHGNLEVGSNSNIQMYFRSETANKRTIIVKGSNCRWWGFG
jgi:uncharacterized protein (DUF427 family)